MANSNNFYNLKGSDNEGIGADRGQTGVKGIDWNNYSNAFAQNAAFYFQFDIIDGYIRDDFVINEGYEKEIAHLLRPPIHYDELLEKVSQTYRISFIDDNDRICRTTKGLKQIYDDGEIIREVECYSGDTGDFWKFTMIFSDCNDSESITLAVICRNITEKKLEQDKRSAYRSMVMKFLEEYSEIASAVDINTGRFEVIFSASDHKGKNEGQFSDLADIVREDILPEFEAEYANKMNLDHIMEKLQDNDTYSFRSFVRDEDGNIRRKLITFCRIIESSRYILAVIQDTTEEYIQEQRIVRIKENTSLNQFIDSSFIQSMVHSHDAGHRILVVEDNDINREILHELLSEEFELVFAENGEKGIRLLEQNYDNLDLVLLDVYMPVCNGFEFLERTQNDPDLNSVPVIVSTGSERHEDEEKCLKLGAVDFITKPYNPESLISRINNVISLNESVSTLSAVEFDMLTGLYTMQAFYYHGSELLEQNDRGFDMVMFYIRDYEAIKSIHGVRKVEETLRFISDHIREHVPNSIIARQEEKFFVLLPSDERMSREQIDRSVSLIGSASPIPSISLNIGFYPDIDKSIPLTNICDRTVMAADSVSDDMSETVGLYDDNLHYRRIRNRNMLESFEDAISNREFVFWLQPKIDITDGRIEGAEALVRWIDKEGNFISPGDFIPLFEKEGYIKELDEYIFRRVCSLQHERISNGEPVIPISVNLSRNSLFSDGIVERYTQIVRSENIDPSVVPIEITESAATSDSRIGELCRNFADAGFVLHMDDFGSGYSSLSSLSQLPFKVLKLDKSLIDMLGTDKGDIIVRNVIDIAKDLGMKVVAEGVEDRNQVKLLVMMRCDMVQGYYYSKPLKVDDFIELYDAEKHFADITPNEILDMTSYPKLNSVQLSKYIKTCRTLFSSVRVLDMNACGYQLYDTFGEIGDVHEHCYKIWGRDERCQNCISLKAFQLKTTEHKFEIHEDQVYLVFSRYIEVDGKPRILELLEVVGSDMLNGFQNDLTFIEAINSTNSELYKDVQLGTYNRRFYEEQHEKLDHINALAMIDIDHFKSVNDSYGHAAGDRLLQMITSVIKSHIRKTDYLIRIGGDEFILAFEGMKQDMLQAKLDSIRMAVEDIRFGDYPDIRVSVSIGACMCNGVTRESVDIADKAMYEGKTERNSVVVRRMA